MTTETTAIQLPEILTANCYFWRPSATASGRRSNEKRRAEEVQRFLDANAAALQAAGVTVNFSYSESCHNVYKTFEVYKHGKKSNVTALKKALGIR